MINVEVATILHFTQVIYQITRHSVLSDIYIWNIVSWQLKHIHSRLNTFHLMGKVNFNDHYSIICLFVCLFVFVSRHLSFFNLKVYHTISKCIVGFHPFQLTFFYNTIQSVSIDLRIHWIPSLIVFSIVYMGASHICFCLPGFLPKFCFLM